jgi:replicative DNA helicase
MTDNVTPLREPGVLPRLPPINVEAEQHLLGAFLCDNRLLEVVADFLRPEHFANATHARIFDAIQKYADRGQTANVVTLKATFGLVDQRGLDYRIAAYTAVHAELIKALGGDRLPPLPLHVVARNA